MRMIATTIGVVLCAQLGLGCVTVAEFRKLERRVIDMQRDQSGGNQNARLADVAAEIDAVRSELQQIRGRLDVAEKRADDALGEARKARQEQASAVPEAAATDAPAAASNPAGRPEAGVTEGQPERVSEEVQAYRTAYNAWRDNEYLECVDRFRQFLQTHPSSPYADDAAFWMADCHFKQGDFDSAVLRFDDVVRNYPEGNKAPDALYRQGESLLKLGPGFHKAARRAFERVLKEYPDSARAEAAKRQLQLITTG